MGAKMLYLRAQTVVLFAQGLDYSVLKFQAPLFRSTEYGDPGDHPGREPGMVGFLERLSGGLESDGVVPVDGRHPILLSGKGAGPKRFPIIGD
jgi:hypothetical protein